MKPYMTKPRKILFDFLQSNFHKEFSAKEIKNALSEQDISLSSIYRNLQFLEREGLIKHVVCDKSYSNEVYYQCVDNKCCASHIHLICERCRQSIHMCEQEQTHVNEHILSCIGFRVNNDKTVIYGVCKDCSNLSLS